MPAARDSADAVAEELARRVSATSKYRDLDATFLRRVTGEAAHRFRDRNQALKYAKRKLHQAFGAFLSGDPARAVAGVAEAVRSGRRDLKTAARAAMRAHASSAERIEWLEPLYERIAAWCGTPRSVVDLACGLNPLAIPWMALAPDATYWCCEVDSDLVAALNGLDEVMPAQITGATRDLVAAPPAVRADLALLFKTVTTLEQQRAGATRRVLAALDCRHVILTLPRRSLSGRREYTDEVPTTVIRDVVTGSGYGLSAVATFGDELVFHLEPEV